MKSEFTATGLYPNNTQAIPKSGCNPSVLSELKAYHKE